VKATLDELRQTIRERYKSCHAFCRDTPELKRSTVYLVLSGKYPGNADRQIVKIETALSGKAALPAQKAIIGAQEAYTVLQEAKCAHCRKLEKGRICTECNMQTMREAQALEAYLASRREHEQEIGAGSADADFPRLASV
jgi:hypothetical protein